MSAPSGYRVARPARHLREVLSSERQCHKRSLSPRSGVSNDMLVCRARDITHDEHPNGSSLVGAGLGKSQEESRNSRSIRR